MVYKIEDITEEKQFTFKLFPQANQLLNTLTLKGCRAHIKKITENSEELIARNYD